MIFHTPICHRLKVGPCGSPMKSMYKGKPFKEKNLVSAGLRAGHCGAAGPFAVRCLSVANHVEFIAFVIAAPLSKTGPLSSFHQQRRYDFSCPGQIDCHVPRVLRSFRVGGSCGVLCFICNPMGIMTASPNAVTTGFRRIAGPSTGPHLL